MIGVIGLVILCVYGLVTALSGAVALAPGRSMGLSRPQAAFFGLLGMAIAVVAVVSRGHVPLWIAGLALLSLLSRVWNGTAMGGVRPSHLVLFGSILTLGTVLTQVK